MWNAYLRKCFLLLLSFLPAIENDYKVRRSNAKYSKTDRPQLVIIGTMTITAACVFTNWDVNNDDTIMFYSMTKSLNSFYFRFLLDLQEIFLGCLAKIWSKNTSVLLLSEIFSQFRYPYERNDHTRPYGTLKCQGTEKRSDAICTRNPRKTFWRHFIK